MVVSVGMNRDSGGLISVLRLISRSATAVAFGLVSVASLAQQSEQQVTLTDQATSPTLAPPPDQPLPTVPPPVEIRLPALTGIGLRVLDEVTSKTAVIGAPVRLALARPLYVTPELGLPAGTPVEGVVIHAAKGGMGGKSGELLLGAKRIVVADGISIPLRSFRIGPAKGQNNEAVAFGVGVAGGAVGAVASMFIVGGSAKVPAGIEANAKTSADVTIPIVLLSKLPAIGPIVVTPFPVVPAAATQPVQTQGKMK
jgi:hypothetical protein